MFTTEDRTSLQSLCESITFNETLVDSIQFTPESVFEELSTLQRDKACGSDHLPAQLLKVAAEFISLPLFHLFQLSLSSGTLPRDLVTANNVPVHKKGDEHLPSNYRPSLTSIVVKVIERIIHRQLVRALESKHLTSDSQHGFAINTQLSRFCFRQLMTGHFALKDGAQLTVYR